MRLIVEKLLYLAITITGVYLSTSQLPASTTSFDFTSQFSSSFTNVNEEGAGVSIESIGGIGRVSGGSASFTENFTDYRWDGISASFNENWTFTTQATLTNTAETLGINNDLEFTLGIFVANSNDPFSDTILLELYNQGTAGRASFGSVVIADVDTEILGPSISLETVPLTISYEATTKQITSFVNGSQLQTVNAASDWGLINGDTFIFGVTGFTAETEIPTDQNYLFFDDLSLTTSSIPEPSTTALLSLAALSILSRRNR